MKRQLEVIGLISQSWNYVNLFVWAIWHVLAQPILGLLGLDFLFCEQWLVRKIKNDDWFINKLFLESDLFNETLMNQSEWFFIKWTDQVLTKLKVKIPICFLVVTDVNVNDSSMRVWFQRNWNIVLKFYTMYDIFYGFWSSENFSPCLL